MAYGRRFENLNLGFGDPVGLLEHIFLPSSLRFLPRGEQGYNI